MQSLAPPSKEVAVANQMANWLHPTRSHGLNHPWQPAECRAVVGPSRASAKVRESDRIRMAREENIRSVSQRTTQKQQTLAETRKAQLQRIRIDKKMRSVAAEAARNASRSLLPDIRLRCDNIVEASLVSARTVSLQQRETVVDGLQKLLPKKKKRQVV